MVEIVCGKDQHIAYSCEISSVKNIAHPMMRYGRINRNTHGRGTGAQSDAKLWEREKCTRCYEPYQLSSASVNLDSAISPIKHFIVDKSAAL